jgi:glycogen debranching enzyme
MQLSIPLEATSYYSGITRLAWLILTGADGTIHSTMSTKGVHNRDKLKKQAYDLLLSNRRLCDGYQYTVPSPDTYPHQWFWDSCFHAIALAHFDITAAEKELSSLISKQFEDGMIPHMIYWNAREKFIKIDWGRHGTSSVTQPPIIGYAVWNLYQKSKNKVFLRDIYDSLRKFYLYLFTSRDTRKHNLIGLINPDESGEDNSPRFDTVLGLPSQQSREENFRKREELYAKNKTCNFQTHECMRNFFWVKDVPFNAFFIYDLVCFSSIADILDKKDDVAFAENQIGLMREAMRKRMYEDGIFWPIYGSDHIKIKSLTWHVFAPIYALLYTQEEAEGLVVRYLKSKEHFASAYPVPTVSRSDPAYDPKGFWRGPTWIGINWFLYKGLKRYGFFKEAEEIRNASCALVEQSGFREYYHPDTGEGLGAKNFTWGTLIVDMLEN